MLTFNEITEIIRMVNQSCIQHFELNHESTHIVIDKNSLPGEKKQSEAPQVTSAAVSLATMPAKDELAVEEKSPELAAEAFHKIISPTVGIFYSAPEPGAEAFAKIGQQVNASEVVCVLEAMKLFNEVEAGVNGTIVEVLVKDGEFVEYGDVLFLVKL